MGTNSRGVFQKSPMHGEVMEAEKGGVGAQQRICIYLE
jgi:hypothetical protein